ncbi:MAG: hypothetical protein FGM41_01320 [Bacteroidetes bacterium]|nr:hypothetical protein [Bacteroidota bacterium]
MMKKYFTLGLSLVLLIVLVLSCKDEVVQPIGLSNMNRVASWNQLNYTSTNTLSVSNVFTKRSNALAAFDDTLAFVVGSGNYNSSENLQIWKFEAQKNNFQLQNYQLPDYRTGAVSFVVGSKLFYGLGINSSGFFNSMYRKNAGSSWSGVSFTGVARSNAVSFVIGSKAYIGLGTNGTSYLRDFYELDAITLVWRKIADLPGSGRTDACAFVLNGKAYVGTGYNGVNYLNDFWEYTPSTNTWMQISNIPGVERDDAVAFAFEKRGYIGTGWNNYTGILSDFYEYNPTTGKWKAAPIIQSSGRYGAVAFTQKGRAYVGCGNNAADLNDFWISK